jgi:hypothetical protein
LACFGALGGLALSVVVYVMLLPAISRCNQDQIIGMNCVDFSSNVCSHAKPGFSSKIIQ